MNARRRTYERASGSVKALSRGGDPRQRGIQSLARKAPSDQGLRSRSARRARFCPGITSPARRGRARAGGHKLRGTSSIRRGARPIGFEIGNQHRCFASPPGGRPGRTRARFCRPISSRPTIGTSARLPGAKSSEKCGSLEHEHHLLGDLLALFLGCQFFACSGEIVARPPCAPFAAGISGSDCISRCTSVPRSKALAVPAAANGRARVIVLDARRRDGAQAQNCRRWR